MTKGPLYQKSLELQAEQIDAVSNEGDYVVDPAARLFSVMEAAHLKKCNFLGCDLK